MISYTNKPKVGIVGWRGLVGSVLLSRMQEEDDFKYFTPSFFSTSQAGELAPHVGQSDQYLFDAYSIDHLHAMDLILTCQGGDYTSSIYSKLRETGWKGFWLDAASTLRMQNDSVIVLDPVNQSVINEGLEKGIKTFVGGNCTVSLLLLALKGLFDENLIEWISSMTYQAVSGAGAQAIEDLLNQIQFVAQALTTENKHLLQININQILKNENIPKDYINVPLLGNVLP